MTGKVTIKELYTAVDGNYEEGVERFLNESLLNTFLYKFLASSCYQELEKAMKEGNLQDAFAASHTLKGLSANMAFTRLNKNCSLLTEDLRAGFCTEETQDYWRLVQNDYNKIKELAGEIG